MFFTIASLCGTILEFFSREQIHIPVIIFPFVILGISLAHKKPALIILNGILGASTLFLLNNSLLCTALALCASIITYVSAEHFLKGDYIIVALTALSSVVIQYICQFSTSFIQYPVYLYFFSDIFILFCLSKLCVILYKGRLDNRW